VIAGQLGLLIEDQSLPWYGTNGYSQRCPDHYLEGSKTGQLEKASRCLTERDELF
jgi:hypothetical protein